MTASLHRAASALESGAEDAHAALLRSLAFEALYRCRHGADVPGGAALGAARSRLAAAAAPADAELGPVGAALVAALTGHVSEARVALGALPRGASPQECGNALAARRALALGVSAALDLLAGDAAAAVEDAHAADDWAALVLGGGAWGPFLLLPVLATAQVEAGHADAAAEVVRRARRLALPWDVDDQADVQVIAEGRAAADALAQRLGIPLAPPGLGPPAPESTAAAP